MVGGQASVASVVAAIVVFLIVIIAVAGFLRIAFVAAVIGLGAVALIVLLVRFLLVCLRAVRAFRMRFACIRWRLAHLLIMTVVGCRCRPVSGIGRAILSAFALRVPERPRLFAIRSVHAAFAAVQVAVLIIFIKRWIIIPAVVVLAERLGMGAIPWVVSPLG